VVERGGLENRCARERTQGSNPCLSAISYLLPLPGLVRRHQVRILSPLFSQVSCESVAPAQVQSAADRGNRRVKDHLNLTESPEKIFVLVAGGAGKHSASIPTFSPTEECSVRVKGL
jgi:hypothetical protein